MFKFLRKYNRWILVIGGSLLMIAFLAPQGIRQLLNDPKGPVVGTLAGRKVRANQLGEAARQLSIINMVLSGEGQVFSEAVLGVDPRDELHWMLLRQAAENAGCMGGEADGRNAVAESFGVEPSVLAERAKVGEHELLGALGALTGVLRYQEQFASPVRLSDVRAHGSARELGDTVLADVVFLQATPDAGAPEPEQAALMEHYQKYRAVQPGTGEYGFGYLQPQGVKIEWLKFDRAAIRAGVTVDEVLVDRRWRENRSKFPGEFAAERDRVVNELTEELVEDAMQRAHQAMRTELFKATQKLEQDGRFRKLPPEWALTRPSMERLAQVAAEQGSIRAVGVDDESAVRFPLPTVTIRGGDWVTPSDFRDEPDLSFSQVRIGNQSERLLNVVFSVRELNQDTPLVLQVGMPAIDLWASDMLGNRIYYTILDARKPGPPDSLDEVRRDVVSGLKRLAAFDALKARVEEIRSKAMTEGLKGVSEAFTPPADPNAVLKPLPPQVYEQVVVSRNGMFNAREADAPSLRDAMFAAAAKLDPLQPADSWPVESSILVVPVPERLGVAVVKIRMPSPVTIETYRMAGDDAVARFAQKPIMDSLGVAGHPLSREKLAARLGWVGRGESAEADDSESTPETPAG